MLDESVPSQKPRITIYLPQRVKDKFEHLADLNERSASAYALHLIEKAIWDAEQSGELLPDTQKQSSDREGNNDGR